MSEEISIKSANSEVEGSFLREAGVARSKYKGRLDAESAERICRIYDDLRREDGLAPVEIVRVLRLGLTRAILTLLLREISFSFSACGFSVFPS